MRIGNANYNHEHVLLRFDDIFGVRCRSDSRRIGSWCLTRIYRSSTVPRCGCITTAQEVTHTGNMRIWVAPMLTDFVEGSSIATLPKKGASCRNVRHYRSDGDYAGHPEDAWGTAGASTSDGPVSGLDCPVGCQHVRGYVDIAPEDLPGEFGKDFYQVDIDVTSIVQAWNEGVLDNKGLRLTSNWGLDSWDVYSSDYAVVPYRPMLIVDYDTIRHDVTRPMIRWCSSRAGKAMTAPRICTFSGIIPDRRIIITVR